MIVPILTLLILSCSYIWYIDYTRKQKIIYYHGTCLGKIGLTDTLKPENYMSTIYCLLRKQVKDTLDDVILVFYQHDRPHGIFLHTFKDQKVSVYADVYLRDVYKIRAITGDSIVRQLRKCDDDRFLLDCCVKTIDQCYGE